MTTWTPLTEYHISLLLSSAQQEALAARPNQGFDNDPLTLAIGASTERVRTAILQNESNALSEDEGALPPELISLAATLCLDELDGKLPGLTLSEDQQTTIDIASDRLSSIKNGATPISLPSEPTSAANVRRTIGVTVERRRENQLHCQRLAGL